MKMLRTKTSVLKSVRFPGVLQKGSLRSAKPFKLNYINVLVAALAC